VPSHHASNAIQRQHKEIRSPQKIKTAGHCASANFLDLQLTIVVRLN
jgi:hypothetical protein